MPKVSLGLGVLKPAASSNTQTEQKVTIFPGSVFENGGLPIDQVAITPAQIDPNQVVLSEPSAPAFHSTLFEDFGLRADGVYNYYTPDESDPSKTADGVSTRDLPRAVYLTWRPTPTQRIMVPTNKGVRPQPEKVGVLPVLPIATAKGSVSNGYVAPGAVQALLVAPIEPKLSPHFDQDLFLSSPSAAGRSAADERHSTDQYDAPVMVSRGSRIRANFVDPSIAGAVAETRVAVSQDHTHLATLGAFSKLISGLEVVSEFNQDVPVRNPPPRFPAPAQTPGLMYTGYLIERYTLGSDGAMTLSRTIDIDDISTVSFVDAEVAFGARYAYRIRTIVQWTRPAGYGFDGLSTLDRSPKIDTSVSSPTRQASFYAGDWSDWSRAEIVDNRLPEPPDELTVRPVSQKRQIHITWKMPADPQRDIASLRLLRATVADGSCSDWTLLGEYVPGNGIYIDTDVFPVEERNQSYLYAMYSISLHGEVSVLSPRIEARITDRSRYLGEEPVRQIGPSGDDPAMHARMRAALPEFELVADRSITFYARGGKSALPLFDRSYVVEVQSIATGQRVEIELAVDSTDV